MNVGGTGSSQEGPILELSTAPKISKKSKTSKIKQMDATIDAKIFALNNTAIETIKPKRTSVPNKITAKVEHFEKQIKLEELKNLFYEKELQTNNVKFEKLSLKQLEKLISEINLHKEKNSGLFENGKISLSNLQKLATETFGSELEQLLIISDVMSEPSPNTLITRLKDVELNKIME